ncbi:MAG: UvrD-helicase domain-containing protein [Mariprofundus sp.]|nr:UvrD-helicase domain-containing protein [Mariprofundus sp.]
MSADIRLKARHPGGSFLVQAPAGSGKTELLTQRILALLAIVDEPEEILALTFTRKAAAEMRKRVLESLSAAKPDPCESHKMETWLLAQQAMAHSRERGWHLLQHAARLRIMTIDSLSHGLARQLPLLSGFGAMPSPSEHVQQSYRDAAEAALNEAMADFSEDAECVLLHQDHNAVAVIGLMADMLAKREQWLDQIAMHGRDMNALRQMLESNLADIMQQQLADCETLLPIELKHELPALMRFAGEQRGDDALQEIHAWPAVALDRLEQWQLIADFLLTATGPSFRKAGGVNVRLGFPAGKSFVEMKDQFKSLLDILADQSMLAESLHGLRQLPEKAQMDDQQWQVLKSLFLLLVLANKHLQQQFSQQGEADFTEIALRAMDALGANDAAPGDLLMKLDYRIHHILVDEFQDTSHLQMHLLQCLTAGWQAGDGRDRSLFLVGDPMQSIYRFRKAEVGLFLNTANNDAGLPAIEALRLERNFRSSPAIVDWVNRAFKSVFSDKQDVISGAVPHAPAVAALSHDGAVNLHLQHAQDTALEAEHIVALVAKALADGKRAQQSGERDKVFRIGILARSRKHLHVLMPALQAAGVAFRAIKILPLDSRPEVRLLRALLRALLHPADRLSWAALLRSPCCGLESYDLHVLMAGGRTDRSDQADGAGSSDDSVWQLIENTALIQQLSMDAQARIAFIRKALAPCVLHSGKVAVRDLLHKAWLRLSMPALIDATASLNVDAALALLESLQQGGRIDFALFDAGLEKLYAAADVSEAAAQVELLTMHGAKGLQWDMVILPGLGHKGAGADTPLLAFSEVPSPGGAMPLMAAKASTRQKDALYALVNGIEKSKDNNEIKRLLYVACTRPETLLHMFGHVNGQSGLATSGSLLQLLLGADADCFGARLWHVEGHESSASSAQMALQRVADVSALLEETDTDDGVQQQKSELAETEYVWAGAEAAPVGNVLHAALQHVAELGFEHWSDDHQKAELKAMRRLLMAEGLSGELLKMAAKRCSDGLTRMLGSERGQWILSQHEQAHCEWALSMEYERHISHHIIDRSFIVQSCDDTQTIRWIIDYKTASHEGGDLNYFLLEEKKRHAPQLQRYAGVLKEMEPDCVIKTALYFPLLDAWIECSNEPESV